MRRTGRAGALAACLAVLAAVSALLGTGSTLAQDAAPHARDAFDLYSDAYPVEPSVGLNSIGVPPRPTATRAKAANPPSSAYARAAAVDTGIAEAYVGKQGPDAEVDTTENGGPTDRSYNQDGLVLAAHAEPSPKAEAAASGSRTGSAGLDAGSSSSRSSVDGTGDRLVAFSEATVNDVAIGALRLGSGRFEATASVTGRPGEAKASGLIVTNDATLSGVPVVIDAGGLRVDESRVPAPQLGLAADAVRQALSQGRYSEVRTVQPTVVTAPDGSSASVSGGGVFVKLGTGDPKNNYFATFTLLGGSATAAIGASLAGGAAAPAGNGSVSGDLLAKPATPASPAAVGPAPAPGAGEVGGAGRPLAGVEAAARYRLAEPWGGWRWLLAAAVCLAVGWQALRLGPLVPARRRIEAAAHVAADRYLRG